MAPDCTNIYQDNIIDKYCKRDKQYEEMCLADFATGYSEPNKLTAKIKNKKIDHISENENSSCDDGDESDNLKNDVKERTKREILRIRKYNKDQDEENYIREQ